MKRTTLTALKALAAAAMMTAASITVGMATGARAEVMARYQTNQWTVEANGTDGAFRNCSMSATYGRSKVMFVLTREGSWGIGVTSPDFNLTPGATGRVAYWVDDVIPRGGNARAIDARTLLVPLENSTQLFEEFRLGSMMNIKAGNQTFQFSLNGTSAALAALTGCARRHSQEARVVR